MVARRRRRLRPAPGTLFTTYADFSSMDAQTDPAHRPIVHRMQEAIIRTLEARRVKICARWGAFLRIEKVSTPLANPDTLVYMFDRTLDEVFAALRSPPRRQPAAVPAGVREKNPLYAYFLAGEQALLEALVLAQAEARRLDPVKRDADVADLKQVMQSIARREIGLLGGVCQPKPAGAPAKARLPVHH